MGSYENILDIIPQREPIVMLDRLIEVDENSATSTFLIKNSNVFFADGALQEPGIIENIAQTAAAMTGYAAKVNNQEVKLGFIGAIKNLKIHKLPPEQSTVNTTVSIQNIVMNITIVNGIVRIGEEIVAECEMRIFIEE